MIRPERAALIVATLACAACDRCGGASDGSRAVEADAGVATAASAPSPADAAMPCSGPAVDLAAAVGDPLCAITSGIAKSMRAAFEANDASRLALRQEAVKLENGRVELRLVNHGSVPVALPLSWHPKIAAFIVLADSAKEKAIYELEAPPLEVSGGVTGARFARVLVAPGGHAFARITIDPKIVRRADRRDAGAADAGLPATLAAGRWTLHIGQLVTDVDTGEPASLAWDVDAPIEADH